MTDENAKPPITNGLPLAVVEVTGIHVLAIEWLCKQLAKETGGTPMQWKVSAFTHARDLFQNMSPNELQAIVDENISFAEEVLRA